VQNDNPLVSRLFIGVTAVETIVLLVAGVGLMLFRTTIGPEWPWELSRFNTILLGSAYAASMVATAMTVYVRRWAPARTVMPMILLFTAVILVVSLIDLDRFDFGYYSAYVWFLLYIVIPVNVAYHIWLYRNIKPFNPNPLAMPWRAILLLPTILLGVYGLGLLLAPASFSDFWPWALDDFHGRMYSVLYLTPALGAIILWRSAAAVELLVLGLTLTVGGFIPIVGVAIVDAEIDKVDWNEVGTWLWNGSFAILFFTGLGLIWRSFSQDTPV
jgi:hypothetical protein